MDRCGAHSKKVNSMHQIFEWSPLVETAGSSAFRILSSRFGDGYQQSVGDGINNKIQSWNLTFKGSAEKIADIKFFLDQHKGYLPFRWSPKNSCGQLLLWDCKEYQESNISHNGRETGVWSLTCTFNQRFEP